jgi:beta-lactamase regulating signal transducer with metallopeptidase domain
MTAEKTFEELFTEPSPEIGMSYTMLSLPRLVEVAIITWGLGLIVSLGFLLRDLRRVHRVRQRMVPCSHELATTLLAQVCQSIGLRHSPALLLSPDLTSPCTAGIRRPAVVLPASMLEGAIDRDALLGVLTHEVAHVRRRDVAWSLLVRFARAIYWWQYELVIIDRRLSQLREEICDNYVLLAPVDRRVYARTLLDFAEASVMRPLVGVIGMMGKNNPLSNRIERMLAEETQPQTRMSRWSRTGLICGGLVAVATVGLLGVWAERAGAVDPLIVRANMQSRILSSSGEARPWSGQSEAASVPAWSGSSSAPRDPSNERSIVTSRPGRTRADSSIPGLAQVRSGKELSGTPPAEPEFSATEESNDFPLRTAPEPEMVQVMRTRMVSQRLPDGNTVQVPENYVEVMSKEEARQYQLSQKSAQVTTVVVQAAHDQTWTNGQEVSLTLSVPESQQVQLPKQIVVRELKVTEPNPQETPPPFAGDDPFTGQALAPTPLDKTAPPAPPTAEPAESSATHKVTLTGPWQAVVTAKWMIELGGVPTLTASTTPETKTEIPAGVTSQGTRYQLVCEATSDETGQLKGILCFGREIPIGEAGPVESFKSFAATWKQQCQSVRQAAPSNDPTPLPPLPSYHDPTPSRPVPGYVLAPTETKAVHLDLRIVLNVPDTMRYGEVQKIAMACDSDDVHVEVRSGSSPAVSAPHRKSYTSVELTRVYDKQGKPVGPGAILVAHKFGAPDPQIITDTHWNRALGDFARRHSNGTNVLLVNADADVPLDVLRDLQIRANREGIEEVQFLTGAVPAALEIQSSDGLFPLLDDLPVRSPQGEFDLDSPNDGIPTYSTDLNPPTNPIPVGTYRGI